MVSTFTSKVMVKKFLTPDIVFLSMSVPPDFRFIPGQYVMFKVVNGNETKSRAYSILGWDGNKLNFVIRILEGGFASSVFKKTKVGAEFELKGPLGHLTFDENAEEHWFIGCGCGIAPLKCMIDQYLPRFPQKKFVLLFSTKKKSDLLFYDELRGLERKHSNFTYLPTLTREEWEGNRGRVQKYLLPDGKNKMFYLCGVRELVEDVKSVLLDKGVLKEKVKCERFS